MAKSGLDGLRRLGAQYPAARAVAALLLPYYVSLVAFRFREECPTFANFTQLSLLQLLVSSFTLAMQLELKIQAVCDFRSRSNSLTH